jgi:glutaminase
MKVHPFTLSPRPATSQNQTAEVKAAFDWTLQMMGLLQKPHNVLLATVEAWQAFNSKDGDIGYFFDDLDEDATTTAIQAHVARHRSIHNIKKMFCELGEYQGNIVALNKKCSDYKQAVSYQNDHHSGC